MNKNDFTTKSTEDLTKNLKSLKFLTGMSLGALGTLFFITLYISLTQGFTPLLILPIGLLPIIVLNFNAISKIKKEIASRNS